MQPDTELWAALEEMDRDGVNQLPVMADGKLQGMLSREDIISYLHTLQELGAAARGRRIHGIRIDMRNTCISSKLLPLRT